jgi:histidinol-phosphate aminotransferase
LITVPARNYGHDVSAMLKAVTPNTRVMFVANPNNPTGTLAPRGDVVRLINELPSSVLLVMDEAYLEFLEDPIDLLPLVRMCFKPNLILMRTFSKIYGLAGLRLGYGIGHPDFISALEKIRQPFNINSVVQAGALAALYDNEHLRRTRQNNTQGLHYFVREFRQMNLEFVPSAANFILVKVGDGQRIFLELQKRGIITRPMAGYNLPQWLRISIGTPAENARCLGALREALAPAPAAMAKRAA